MHRVGAPHRGALTLVFMKLVIQRVALASVTVDGKTIASVGQGLLILVGFTHSDTLEEIFPTIEKILKLRIFADQAKPINISIQDIQGEILLVPQFTLYADCKGGNRPSFIDAMKPEPAKILYEQFVKEFQKKWPKTSSGIFGADMKVSLVNDGPVTIVLPS